MEAIVFDDQEVKGLLPAARKVDIDLAKVKAQLAELQELLPPDPEPTDGTVRPWRMDEIQLTVQLSASGGVMLVGTVGVTGGIQVTFKRTS